MERAINKNHKTLLKKIKNLPGEHAQWSRTIKCQFRQTNLKRKKEKYKTMPKWYIHASSQQWYNEF
jgi:hypothetical protein